MMIRIRNITSPSRSLRGVNSHLLFSSASLASSSSSSSSSLLSSLATSSCCSNWRSKQQHHPVPPLLVNNNYQCLSTATASISVAQLVKQLREATGAPMMECKKALSDPSVSNDITKAMEWLRKHGSAKALSKVSGREALEGLVGIQIINNNTDASLQVASLVRVASETDFASRSEVLSSFVQEVANAAASAATATATTPTTVDVENIPSFLKQTKTSSSSSSYEDNNKTLDQCLSDTILAIRENLQVDCITTVQASSQQSIFGGYVHGRASPMSTCGSAASIVELVPIKAGVDATAAACTSSEAARKLAMHIVAAKPTYLNIDSVPPDIIAKEKEILHSKMISDGKTVGKPPDIIDKIIQGQLRKYYESVCLTEQIHMIEEGGVKVSKVLSDLGLEVKSFQLVGLGK